MAYQVLHLHSEQRVENAYILSRHIKFQLPLMSTTISMAVQDGLKGFITAILLCEILKRAALSPQYHNTFIEMF